MRTITILIFLIFCFSFFGQNNTQLSYDAAGNRISRTTIIDFAGLSRTHTSVINELEFNVFPNTVENKLNIKVDTAYRNIEKAEYKLYDYNGKLIFSKRAESFDETLDFQSVSTGVYLLRLENPFSETVEWKIVKN